MWPESGRHKARSYGFEIDLLMTVSPDRENETLAGSAAERGYEPGIGKKRLRALLVSSGGGHWVQLNRLAPAFSSMDTVFVTVNEAYRSDVAGYRFHRVVDATRWNKLKLMWMATQIFWIVLRERPTVVVSTGAAPGAFALMFGRLLKRRTIWVDSIANVEKLSMSGDKARRFADLHLTQWEHLAVPGETDFVGAVV